MCKRDMCLAYTCPNDASEKHNVSTKSRNVDVQHGASPHCHSKRAEKTMRGSVSRSRFDAQAICCVLESRSGARVLRLRACKTMNVEQLVAELACERDI